MTWDFTPTSEDRHKTSTAKIPNFEESRADYAPYYASEKSLEQAMAEVKATMQKIGATAITFQGGHFSIAGQKRYGYRIRYRLHGGEGVLPVAGLPIRKETPRRIEQVKIQCLLNVRDWFKAYLTSQVFTPGSNPLTLHLLADGERTFAELVTGYVEEGKLPRLPEPKAEIIIEEETYE